MKAVIPVAGLGTRMLPATKSIPKEMLTIADKPIIQYIVNECVMAGFKEIIFVTHSSKNAIENHFDTSFELEVTLEKRVKRQELAEVRGITPHGVTIMHVRQGHAKGLGHAVLCARSLISENEPFAVILPDVLLNNYSANQREFNLAEMVSHFKEEGKSQIMVSEVDRKLVNKYGIVDINNKNLNEINKFQDIKDIVEKPSIEEAPSNLFVVGRYIFTPEIWEYLERVAPGVDGEIQLTDAISLLIKNNHSVEAYLLQGTYFDCGSKIGYWKAFLEYSIRDANYGDELLDYLKERVNDDKKQEIDLTQNYDEFKKKLTT